MLISQIIQEDGSLAVVLREGSEAAIVKDAASTYALAASGTARSFRTSCRLGNCCARQSNHGQHCQEFFHDKYPQRI